MFFKSNKIVFERHPSIKSRSTNGANNYPTSNSSFLYVSSTSFIKLAFNFIEKSKKKTNVFIK